MTDEIVIRSENLGKKYVIGHQLEKENYVALRDVIAETAKSAALKTLDTVRGRKSKRNGTREEFWALKDVSFDVRRGEVLGIIGGNGAGKSTLLKILSRITEPTEGRVTIRGRVASLLEVGTGFHPELTGRENIYLNGAILGMARAEVKRKFEEIVAFAEVEKFLDTPVKRYSSGMYVRLAFAVAAHLEPEILIVDEVLAVGDAEFQKKCLGKMSAVASHGRTVLFVSHNVAAIEALCTRAILLKSGCMEIDGNVTDVVQKYISRSRKFEHSLNLDGASERTGLGRLRFSKLEIWGNSEGESPKTGGTLHIRMTFDGEPGAPRPSRVGIALSTIHSVPLILCSTEMSLSEPPMISTGDSQTCIIPNLPMPGGQYLLTLFIEQSGEIEDWLPNVCQIEVADADYFGFGKNVPSGYESRILLVQHSWSDTLRSSVECDSNWRDVSA